MAPAARSAPRAAGRGVRLGSRLPSHQTAVPSSVEGCGFDRDLLRTSFGPSVTAEGSERRPGPRPGALKMSSAAFVLAPRRYQGIINAATGPVHKYRVHTEAVPSQRQPVVLAFAQTRNLGSTKRAGPTMRAKRPTRACRRESVSPPRSAADAPMFQSDRSGSQAARRRTTWSSTGRINADTAAPSSGQHPQGRVRSNGSRPWRHSLSASRPSTPASSGQRPQHSTIAAA